MQMLMGGGLMGGGIGGDYAFNICLLYSTLSIYNSFVFQSVYHSVLHGLDVLRLTLECA